MSLSKFENKIEDWIHRRMKKTSVVFQIIRNSLDYDLATLCIVPESNWTTEKEGDPELLSETPIVNLSKQDKKFQIGYNEAEYEHKVWTDIPNFQSIAHERFGNPRTGVRTAEVTIPALSKVTQSVWGKEVVESMQVQIIGTVCGKASVLVGNSKIETGTARDIFDYTDDPSLGDNFEYLKFGTVRRRRLLHYVVRIDDVNIFKVGQQ